MSKEGYSCIAIISMILFGLAPNPTQAWEFKMTGTFNYIYEYYGQLGNQGFFGPYNVDNSAGTNLLPAGDFRALNGWFGKQVSDLVSGADAAKHYQNLQLYPEFRLTPAVRFLGKYRLGAYGDTIRSEYITNTRPGKEVAASDGQWTMWWVTAQTPWGIIAVGKRPEAFGLGVQYNGSYNNTTEGVALVTQYGPLRMSIATRPFWPEPPNSQISSRRVPDNPNVKPMPGSTYFNLFDKSGIQRLAVRFFVTYQAGPIDVGAFLAVQRWSAGPEAKNASRTSAIVQNPPVTTNPGPNGRGWFYPFDLDQYHGTVYLKYTDGRFFFNTEWAWWYETDSVHPSAIRPSKPIQSPVLKFSVESWRRVVECGAYAGPAKISLFYAFMPGPDRRNGRLLDKQPYFQAPGQGAYGLFLPYSFLLGYAYGSGVNAYDANLNGYINCAEVFATRVDYAVASNLNVFGSLLYARRSSDGFGRGYIRPALASSVTQVVNAPGTGFANIVKWTPYTLYQANDGSGTYDQGIAQYPGAPAIDSTDLGWEADAGFQWELLDRYKLKALIAYWAPGGWFKGACIDRSVQNWNVQTMTNYQANNPTSPYGVRIDRTIDPIIGGQVALEVTF